MIHYQDESVTLHHGHSLDVLKTLPDRSVDCCVTSPPYFGLRDYGEPGQYGLEKSPAEYVDAMRVLFAEVRRVLAVDGTLWLNLGDSYNSAASGQNGTGQTGITGGRHDRMGGRGKTIAGLPTKNLLGIPWRVAFALQDDGWVLRNDIIWSKPNAMPESVTDRLSTRHELIFMFSKSRRYWFDLDPIRDAYPESSLKRYESSFAGTTSRLREARIGGDNRNAETLEPNPKGRNPGDVWEIATQPFPGAHFAVFPVEIPRRCIAAGCAPKVCRECGHKPPMLTKRRDARLDCGHNAYEAGTVLDPFSGSGTTGLAAGQLGRKYVGIDLSRKYLDLSLQTRLAQTALLDGGAA